MRAGTAQTRLHCVAEITLSTTFLLASEVPAIAAFARSGLHQKRNFKKRERGTESRLIVPRSRVLKLRFFIHPPACGRVGRGSGRGGPSPGLRARLSQRESDISRHVFISCFTYPNSFSTVKSAIPKLTLRVTKKSANASIVAQLSLIHI